MIELAVNPFMLVADVEEYRKDSRTKKTTAFQAAKYGNEYSTNYLYQRPDLVN